MKLKDYLKDYNDFNFFEIYIKGQGCKTYRRTDSDIPHLDDEVDNWIVRIGNISLAVPFFVIKPLKEGK